jgi:hypothetical protein
MRSDCGTARIVANVLVSHTGEVTDYHLAVTFVEKRP